MTENKENQAPIAEDSPAQEASKTATKLLGIPKKDYIKFTYIALMAASALGLIAIFVSAFSGLAGLVGLAGVILALLGFFVYGPEFTDGQLSHFKFVGVVFVATFILGILLSIIFSGVAALAMTITPLVNVAALIAMYAGYRLNERRTPASKESVINELKSLKP